MSRRARTVLLLAALGLALPPVAAAGTGRVVHATGDPVPVRNVDGGSGGVSVPLPDGRLVLVRSSATKALSLRMLTATGALTAPSAPVRLPGASFTPKQVIRLADGRLRLLGTTPATTKYQTDRLALAGLTADGAVDEGFGRGGVVSLGIQESCGGCSPMALAPDGSLLVTGSTGQVDPKAATHPNAPNSFAWVLVRLTPAGAPDTSFATAGVLPVPGTAPNGGAGYATLVGADGRVTLLGAQGNQARLTRLLADGSADPGFGGGTPVAVPGQGSFELAAAAGGAVLVSGFGQVVRFTASGAPDPAFGTGGTATLPGGGSVGTGLVESTPDGGATVFTSTYPDSRPAGEPTLTLHRLDAAGHDTATGLRLGFGGGTANVYRTAKVFTPVPPLAQDSFATGAVVPRPGGGYLVLGSVAERQYTHEGEGFSGAQIAAAALTPALTLDPSFGPEPAAVTVRTRLLPQHAGGVRRFRGVAVRVKASGPGLVLLRVRDTAGRVLAEGVEPIYAAGTSTVRVQIAREGARRLRHATRVRVGTRFRSVLGGAVEGPRVTATLRG